MVGSARLQESCLQLLRRFAHHVLSPVVLVAVLPDQPDFSHELLGSRVDVVAQLLLHRPQVHGVFDDVQVVWHVELDGVHRLLEVVGAFDLAALGHDACGCGLPGVPLVDGVLRDGVGVGEVGEEFRLLLDEICHFSLREVVRISSFIHEHYLVGLLQILESSEVALLPLDAGLLHAGAVHDLGVLLQLLELVSQEVNHFLKLSLLSILERVLVGCVYVRNIRPLLDQYLAHLQVASPGCIEERSLSCKFVSVVNPV